MGQKVLSNHALAISRTCTSSRSVRASKTSCSPNRCASTARRERLRPPDAAAPKSSYLQLVNDSIEHEISTTG